MPTCLRLFLALPAILAAVPLVRADSSSQLPSTSQASPSIHAAEDADAIDYAPEVKGGAKPYDWKSLLSSPERVLLLGPAIPACPANRDELLSLLPQLKAAGFTHVLLAERLAPGWVESQPLGEVPDLSGDGLEPLREALRKAGLLRLRGSAQLPVDLSTGAAPDAGPPLKDGEVRLPEPGSVKDSLDCASSLPLEERWLAGLARLLQDQPTARVLILFGTDAGLQDAFEDVLSIVHGVPSRSFRLLRWNDRPYYGALRVAGLADQRVSFEPMSRRGRPARFLNAPSVSSEECRVASDEHPGLPRAYSNYACRQDSQALKRILDFSEEVFRRSTDTAAGLAHLRSHLEKTRDWGGTRVCFCKTPGARGVSHLFGTMVLDHGFRSAEAAPEAAKVFWHELQHDYDQMRNRKRFSHSLESEQRAWDAGCRVLLEAAELGLAKEPKEGDLCSQGFPQGNFCGRVRWAAEDVLALEGSPERLERPCSELERALKGNPLSLEGFRFDWAAEECLRRAKAAVSAKDWESMGKYCEFCDRSKGMVCITAHAVSE